MALQRCLGQSFASARSRVKSGVEACWETEKAPRVLIGTSHGVLMAVWVPEPP